MDRSSIGGIGIAVGALLVAVVLDGSSPAALINVSAFVLVVGGTIGATMASYRMADFKNLKDVIRVAFRSGEEDVNALIRLLVGFSVSARRDGLLALDARVQEVTDPFLRSGLQAVVDGVDPEFVRLLMETELQSSEARHRRGASMLETAGGYAPTMGIIGTVMGLVHVLSNLTSASSLGPAIATAFIATFYGIFSANVVWLPLGGKLKVRSQEETLVRELMIEGVLSIQSGDNPRAMEEKLRAFLPPRAAGTGDAEGTADTKTAEAPAP